MQDVLVCDFRSERKFQTLSVVMLFAMSVWLCTDFHSPGGTSLEGQLGAVAQRITIASGSKPMDDYLTGPHERPPASAKRGRSSFQWMAAEDSRKQAAVKNEQRNIARAERHLADLQQTIQNDRADYAAARRQLRQASQSAAAAREERDRGLRLRRRAAKDKEQLAALRRELRRRRRAVRRAVVDGRRDADMAEERQTQAAAALRTVDALATRGRAEHQQARLLASNQPPAPPRPAPQLDPAFRDDLLNGKQMVATILITPCGRSVATLDASCWWNITAEQAGCGRSGSPPGRLHRSQRNRKPWRRRRLRRLRLRRR